MKKLVRAVAKKTDNPVLKKYLEEHDREIWMNDIYMVTVNRNMPTPMEIESKPVTVCWLSIKRLDNRALTDWRDFQWIKNQLVGEENEGCEIFPAESRLVDGANQYHIWVFEQTEMRFPFGFNERMVTEKKFLNETQRKFPENRKPKDLAECEEKAEIFFKEYGSK